MSRGFFKSFLAAILIVAISGCSTSKPQSTEKIESNPYIKRLDDLNTKGATGNLLACMYFIKRTLFIVESSAGDITATEGIDEAYKRAESNASGKLLKLLKSNPGSAVTFCYDMGEIDPSTSEYINVKDESLSPADSAVKNIEPSQKSQWDSGVLIEYAACLGSHKGNEYFHIADRIGFCAGFLGSNYDSKNPKQVSEVQTVQYRVCLETWNLTVKEASIDDKIHACKRFVYNPY